MADATRWVGLDAHASQTTIAVLDQGSAEISRAKLRGSPEKVVPGFMAGVDGRVIGVYEPGPTGMGLARTARAMGIDLRVGALGLIPRKPTDRIKTDARDAERLAVSRCRQPVVRSCPERARGGAARSRARPRGLPSGSRAGTAAAEQDAAAPRAEPQVGRSSSNSVRIVVVLPAPLGPRKPKNSPASIVIEPRSMPRAPP